MGNGDGELAVTRSGSKARSMTYDLRLLTVRVAFEMHSPYAETTAPSGLGSRSSDFLLLS